MSNRRKTRQERDQKRRERGGRCPDGSHHDWVNKPGYGVVCTNCNAKAAAR